MLVTILLFALGLILLIKGGDWFVDGATGIAYKFHIPEILIGATVVSIGTTLPEVMVSATSALGGHGEIAYGNAIGFLSYATPPLLPRFPSPLNLPEYSGIPCVHRLCSSSWQLHFICIMHISTATSAV